MKEDIEQKSVAFHDRARKVLYSLYSDFIYASGSIDRLRNENAFQQLQGKYAGELRAQLHSIALELLQKAERGIDLNELSYILNGYIEDYVREFVQKVRAL